MRRSFSRRRRSSLSGFDLLLGLSVNRNAVRRTQMVVNANLNRPKRLAMHKRWILGFAAGVASLLAGCAAMKQARLLEPTSFGMEQVAPRVYVKKGVSQEQRRELIDSYEKARQQVMEFYGGLFTDPTVYGCDTRECIESIGGRRASNDSGVVSRRSGDGGGRDPEAFRSRISGSRFERVSDSAHQRSNNRSSVGSGVRKIPEPQGLERRVFDRGPRGPRVA